jgi:hypothetical protein
MSAPGYVQTPSVVTVAHFHSLQIGGLSERTCNEISLSLFTNIVAPTDVILKQTNKQTNKTKQNKTKQNKTKQNKTKQNKTKQNK